MQGLPHLLLLGGSLSGLCSTHGHHPACSGRRLESDGGGGASASQRGLLQQRALACGGAHALHGAAARNSGHRGGCLIPSLARSVLPDDDLEDELEAEVQGVNRGGLNCHQMRACEMHGVSS
jgi:hypothetical protein